MNFNQIDFVKHSKKFMIVSLTVVVLGVLSLFMFGLNLGVDYSSGTTMDISVGTIITSEEATELFEKAGHVPPVAPTIGGNNQERLTVRYKDVLSEEQRKSILAVFEEKYGAENVAHEENTVDAGMARELGLKTILYVAIACVGIALYVSIRFEWRFAVASIVPLAYNAFAIVAIFSIFRLEINLPFVAAVLTIVGYTINDTIVIFDRIRENMRFAKLKTYGDIRELVNTSVRQSFTRTVNTGITVIFTAACLLVFGSEAIQLFSLAILIGLVFGAFSSIFLASPLWMTLKNKSLQAKRSTPSQTS